jgi:hypothetical protein
VSNQRAWCDIACTTRMCCERRWTRRGERCILLTVCSEEVLGVWNSYLMLNNEVMSLTMMTRDSVWK